MLRSGSIYIIVIVVLIVPAGLAKPKWCQSQLWPIIQTTRSKATASQIPSKIVNNPILLPGNNQPYFEAFDSNLQLLFEAKLNKKMTAWLEEVTLTVCINRCRGARLCRVRDEPTRQQLQEKCQHQNSTGPQAKIQVLSVA